MNLVDVLNGIWNQILEITSLFVMPDWGGLIGLLPVLVVLGLVAPFLTFLALGTFAGLGLVLTGYSRIGWMFVSWNCFCMLGAAVVLAGSAPGMRRGAVIQGRRVSGGHRLAVRQDRGAHRSVERHPLRNVLQHGRVVDRG